ncbi:hypothetical protein CHUAL_000393 [Chamberlinius hualienensis]
MDSEIVLVSTSDEMNPELVEVFENENVIGSDHFELSSTIDLESEVIETATLQLIDNENEQQEQTMEQHLYTVVCTDSNGEVVEEVTVNGEHNSVIEITVDDSMQLPGSDVINESYETDTESVVKVEVEENGSNLEEVLSPSSVETVGELFNETITESVTTVEGTADTVQEDVDETVSNTFTEPMETNEVETFSEVIEEPVSVPFSEVIEESSAVTFSEVIEEPSSVTFSEVIEESSAVTFSEVIEEPSSVTFSEVIEEPTSVTFSEVIEEQSTVTFSDVIEEPSPVTFSEVIEEPSSVTFSEVIEEPPAATFNEVEEESTVTFSEVIEEPSAATFNEVEEQSAVTFSEVIEEPATTIFNVREAVESTSELVESVEMTSDTIKVEAKAEVIETNTESEENSETAGESEFGLSNGVSNGDYNQAVDEKSMIESENDIQQQTLDDTAVSTGGADTTLNTTDTAAVKSSVEGETQDDEKFIIDTSQPIELKVDSIVMINGRKSIIQNHPDKEGELIAYPIKESQKNRKRRGRPRKQRQPYVVEEEEDVEDKSKLEEDEEEKTEKGFVQMADASGTVVKRSARKRKRASHLDEYETGLVGAVSDNDSGEDDNDAKIQKPNISYGFRGRGRGRGAAAVTIGGRGRGRGRPRRFVAEPEKVETPVPKPLPKTQPQQQAYLVQMADGRTVVIQVPVTGLAEGMTSQSLAMSVAEALSSGQSSGVLNISVQRGSGNTVTTEKIEIKKNEKGMQETTNTKAPTTTTTSTTAASTTTINSVSTVSSAPPSTAPLTLIPLKTESTIPIGLNTSNAELTKFRCTKCQYQGCNLQQIHDHLETAHGGLVQKCKLCLFITLEKNKLIDHFKEKHPKCICPTCNFMVEQPFTLRRHMQKHITSRTTCTICGKTYKDRYIMRIHMRMVHMPAKVQFECPLCKKKFNRKAHLGRHLRTHNPAKQYKCSKCDYRGTEKSDVTKHSLIHEEPKHSCEVCGHSFRHLRNKEIHMKRHTGQKDYKCGVCDFYSYTFTDIRKHIDRKHSADPNTLVCTKCGQAFLDDLQLSEHITTGQCELYVQEKALLDTEDLPLEDEEMEVESTVMSPTEDPPSIHLSEESLSVVVNSSEMLDIKSSEGEVLSSENVDVNCQPQTISLVSDGVEFDGSHGLLTLLSEDGQVIRGIILDSGELDTQIESTVVVEEVS